MDNQGGPGKRAFGQLDSSGTFAAVAAPSHATREPCEQVLQVFPKWQRGRRRRGGCRNERGGDTRMNRHLAGQAGRAARPCRRLERASGASVSASRRGWLRWPAAEGFRVGLCADRMPMAARIGPWAKCDAESGPRRRPRNTDEGVILFALSGRPRTAVRLAGSRALGGLTSAIAEGRSALARVARPRGGPLSDQ